MICYPRHVSDNEISLINDYWELSKESQDEFKYKTTEIPVEKVYAKKASISYLPKGSFLPTQHPAFICATCKKYSPVTSRNQFIKRIKIQRLQCKECKEKEAHKIKGECISSLENYKKEKFQPKPYLDSLDFIETLALLSLFSNAKSCGHLLAASPSDLKITNAKIIDQQLFASLLQKGALIHVSEIPPEVEKANQVLYSHFENISYDNWHPRRKKRPHNDAVVSGVYLNTPQLETQVEREDVTTLLYEKLISMPISMKEVEKLRQLANEIQIHKLYILVVEISRKHKIRIENSNTLRALLYHLAENYEPHKIFYTFGVKADEAIAYIHKQDYPRFGTEHYFAKFVSGYIETIESRNWTLKRYSTLPPTVETSPVEALFSQLYLDGHFDWNRLSAKEVVSRWLDKVQISGSFERSLT
ncbi:hypothetical protein QQM79_03755 [Marinobacteraceae bacterium S3BR75-40.1]